MHKDQHSQGILSNLAHILQFYLNHCVIQSDVSRSVFFFFLFCFCVCIFNHKAEMRNPLECTERPLNNCVSLNIFTHFDKFNFPWTQRIRGKTFLWWEQKQQEVLTRKSLPGGELAAPTERTICLLLLPNHWQLPSPALHTRTQWLRSSLPIPL